MNELILDVRPTTEIPDKEGSYQLLVRMNYQGGYSGPAVILASFENSNWQLFSKETEVIESIVGWFPPKQLNEFFRRKGEL